MPPPTPRAGLTAARLAACALLAILLPTASGIAATPRPTPPNILLILADDLGWADLGIQGADLHETPHLDQLARNGVRFTNAYAMSVCSPTRAMILTGRHAARLGMTVWIEAAQAPAAGNRRLLDAESRAALPHEEITLAARLQSSGYVTALVGKWHLGDANHAPETHGFDINIGGTHWGAPTTFWYPYRGGGRFPEFRYVPHLEFGSPGEYLTDRLTDEALRIIDRAGDQPFFLFLSHHAPHTPIEAKADDIARFTAKVRPSMRQQNPVYAAMLKSLDDGVGRILRRLDERGLARRTLVVFASDNGGFLGIDRKSGLSVPTTNNAPLRSGKGSLYEGGIRVPLLVRWPGVTPPGKVCDEPVSLADLFPTLLAAAALPPAPGRALDGLDLAPLLRDPSARLGRASLFFHYPHYYATTTPAGAIRAGNWKLLEFFEDGRQELFNLASDPGEETDLATREPDRAAALAAELARWRTEVGARLPRPNPAYRPAAGGAP